MCRFIMMTVIRAILLTCLTASAHALQCTNALGQAVDWWVALKRPGLSVPDGGRCAGSTYLYMDDTMASFVRDECLECPTGNPLSASLDPIYSSPETTSYVTINDQPSSINETTRGMIDPELHAHAKGVLAFDREGGLWLTHSTPEFPNAPSQPYAGIGGCSASGECGAQHGQLRFGQSFMCVSLGLDVLDGLASAIRTAAPVIASWRLVPGVEMPGIRALVDGWESRAVGVMKISWHSFASVAGQGFLYSVKSPTPRGQAIYLYEEVIEPLLGDSLLVQSWSNVESECSRDGTAATMTVAELAFPEGTSWRAGFSDHSKWAVTVHGDIATVCMADLNRDGLDPEWSEGPDRPQSLRGGGATCLQHPTLWIAMREAVASTQPCVFATLQA